jgi:hypothetical protein
VQGTEHTLDHASPSTATAALHVDAADHASAGTQPSDDTSVLRELRVERERAERITEALCALPGELEPSAQTYLDVVQVVAVPTHGPGEPARDAIARHLVRRYAAARSSLLEGLTSYDAWFRVMRALDPEAELFEVPERFVFYDDSEPVPAFTIEDLDAAAELQELLARS